MWCGRISRTIGDSKVQKRKNKDMLRDWGDPPEERVRNKK